MIKSNKGEVTITGSGREVAIDLVLAIIAVRQVCAENKLQTEMVDELIDAARTIPIQGYETNNALLTMILASILEKRGEQEK